MRYLKGLSKNRKLVKSNTIPKNGLIRFYGISNNEVYEKISNDNKGLTTKNGFMNGNDVRFFEGKLQEYTLVFIFSKPFNEGYVSCFNVNDSEFSVRYYSGEKDYRWTDYSYSMSSDLALGTTIEYRNSIVKPRSLSNDKLSILAICGDSVNNILRTKQGKYFSEKEVENVNEINTLKLMPSCKCRNILIYDRMLSKEELEEIRLSLIGESQTEYSPFKFARKIAGMDVPNNFLAEEFGIPHWNHSDVQTDVIRCVEPNIEDDMIVFTDLFFINTPEFELEVGQMYNIEAHPYPYDIYTTPYHVAYESSNNEVISCFKGVLAAKNVGNATITASIPNTDISKSVTINVVEKKQVVENLYSVPIKHLSNRNPENTLIAIVDAIDYASQNGYNGVLFPKSRYAVKPYKSGVICEVPSDFIIDFNDSVMTILDNEYGRSRDGYVMFSFGNGDYENFYKYECKNSVIRNLTVYGERTGISAEEDTDENFNYTFSLFAKFECRSVYCKIQNCNFYNTLGFNIATSTNGYRWYDGTGQNGSRRGVLLGEDFSSGRMDENGTVINASDWWYTTDFIKIGYTYGATDYTGIEKYKIGKKGYITYGIDGRWYDIFFYDKDYSLISFGKYQFAMETYNFPPNAVYMKMNVHSIAKPTTDKNEVPSYCRLYPSVDPDLFEITDCNFINPSGSAYSVVGGTRSTVSNVYAENGKWWGWAIDYEDGYMGQRHHILNKILCNGMVTFPGGHNIAVINSTINNLYCYGDTEQMRLINNVAYTITNSVKTEDIIENCTYWGMTHVSKYAGVTRFINNTVDTNRDYGSN